MSDDLAPTAQLQRWLARLQDDDPEAREEVLRHAGGRLQRLTRKLLNDYPGVRRWEQTDDVLQNAVVRLLRALRDVRPATVREFLGLAALQIRRELLDLARHYYGPQGAGAHHASQAGAPDGAAPPDPGDSAADPARLAEWCEAH